MVNLMKLMEKYCINFLQLCCSNIYMTGKTLTFTNKIVRQTVKVCFKTTSGGTTKGMGAFLPTKIMVPHIPPPIPPPKKKIGNNKSKFDELSIIVATISTFGVLCMFFFSTFLSHLVCLYFRKILMLVLSLKTTVIL